jgi:hypothetical protein
MIAATMADRATPLQNRVRPDGDIVATPERGLMLGNRGGCFHRADRTLGRTHWANRQWICCVLSFKGRRRVLMQPNRYTELFFLDEATALAAGHRPCFECRRTDATRFARLWAACQRLPASPSAPQMDRVLHEERLTADRRKRHFEAEINALPDGVMVRLPEDDTCYLLDHDRLLPWSFAGYGPARPRPADETVRVLTPSTIVAVLSSGYRPMLHPSAAT